MVTIDLKTRTFVETYDAFYPLVYGTAYSRFGNAEDARDIAQEVFLRLYEKFETVEAPRKWIFGALRNVMFEHYRKKAGDIASIDVFFNDIRLAFVNGFRDTRILIEEALENTQNFSDERERTLFELISIYHFTYREAGSQVGLSERQVRYRYGLLTSRLEHYFKKLGINSLEDLL